MHVVGLDDTDSRETGMCTTYVGAVLGERLERAGYDVVRHLLVRCNPAVQHKTRGNAAVALHVDTSADVGESTGDGTAAVDAVTSMARETITEFAATDDPQTNPGLVVAPAPEAVPGDVREFATEAVRDHHEIDDAVELAERHGYRTAQWGNGRGRIGALAAVGAWRATDEWTYERISYRERERWGTERSVDDESVFAAADEHYPSVWDTVDRSAGEVVCVPHTPGPVLFGIRGDDPEAVIDVARAIDAEPTERAVTFVTNQGTDAHVRASPAASSDDAAPSPDGAAPSLDDAAPSSEGDSGAVEDLRDGRSYRVDGVVANEPETRSGGHVFVDVRRTGVDTDRPAGEQRLECVAFEPTKRFRDRVRALRPGDVVTVSGEVADGTLKLEKFALRDAVRTEAVTPECPSCGRRMKSAGADQGYRCRDCGTSAPGREERRLDRELDVGWYEVPPLARRHVAKPLVRGGFDAPTHPER